MADSWYYAEGGQRRGPFSISELLTLLAGIADPRRVLVWRHGFENWKPAGEVHEITQQLLQSPPPSPASPPVEVIREAAAPAEDGASFKDVQPEMTGISGWLGLLAFGQMIGIVRLVVNTAQYVQSISSETWVQFSIVFWGEIAMNVALIGLAIWTAVLLFMHSRRFPAFFIVQMICAVLIPLIDLVWVASIFSIGLNRPFGDFFTIEPLQVARMVVGAISAAIWITYVLRSRRVANTFTE
ncbi:MULTISPECIES: DUF2569 family protein [unclassified Bradyrhizobium]|uniref:DUF2569 family protein n=1 Tax=Bradyrhizobium TaxID=374 RepID=UPI001CD6EFC2|nr:MULTISPECIES: DUF2569 family protein [unclassified Bradyrhizobium]MCA1378317.1 DUF2569 family protein [Bradyrhizobium sp. IC4060]MCA1472487.1 DUF2569 family protein [Bradyrhizobium sp. IC3195]MCA1487681.1 DUF2569 family protein [Bradyrhizobium sp. IC4061]MCA1499370.1 DUF2569 family protein [Bradyrhizobium sp. NBAIM14]MCA1535907.1 DUF2569 family protein [Bradyrhizobium sp. NBAIM03]